MVMLQFRTIFFLLLATIVYSQTYDVEDLKGKIKDYLEDKENEKNVVKVLGLDMSNFGEREEDIDEKLCSLIKTSSPELIGLQEVQISQLIELKNCFSKIKDCHTTKIKSKGRSRRSRKTRRCSRYEIVGSGSSNSEETTFFNPIIFKRKRGLRSLAENGTFWLSETPEKPFTKLDSAIGHGICSWAKLRYAVREGPPKKDLGIGNAFFETLITVLKNKKNKKEKRTTKWLDFYFLNTQFDEDIDVAIKQFEILYDYLSTNIMKHSPNAPIVLSAGIRSDEVASKLSQAISSRSLQEVIVNSRQVYNRDPSSQSKTFIFQRGLVNLVGVKSLENLQAQFAAILFE